LKSNLQYGFSLGEFWVRPVQCLIVGPAAEHHIPRHTVDVLLCLAEASGDLVELDELLQSVWGNEATDLEALEQCVCELRQVFGDQPDNPQYIETVPDRGYRLLVEIVPDHPVAEPHQSNESKNALEVLWDELKGRNVVRVAIAYAAVSWLVLQLAQIVFETLRMPDWAMPAILFLLAAGFLIAVVIAWLFQVVPEHKFRDSGRRGRLKMFVDVGIIGILVIAVGMLSYRQFVDVPIFAEVDSLPSAMTSPEPAEKSIAVLRFASFGGDSLFGNGLGEHLLNLLARVGDLKVPSRQATWVLSDQNVDPIRIAKTLRVKYVLEGSVQQQNERIRVTAQLIDGVSGAHVWSEHYDEILSAENFFNIQDAIAQQVVQKLKATVSQKGTRQLATRRTENDDALIHYLAGRDALNRPKTDMSLTTAVQKFETAIGLDPRFAEAHAGLCEAHLAWYVTYRNVEYFDAAQEACMRALQIDNDVGEVYAALGSLHRYGGQYDLAEEELLRARELLNNPALVLEELGRTYRAQNKLVLAEQTFNEAIVVDPANWSVYKSMANFLFRTGRYQEALPYYKQVTVIQRDSAVAFSNIGSAFFMLGDFKNSTLAWQRSIDLEPTHFVYMNVGNSLYYQGNFQESVGMYRKAIELGAGDARAWGSLAASCHYVQGEEECSEVAYGKAIELIKESLAVNPLDANSLARLSAYLTQVGKLQEARATLARLDVLNWSEPDVPFFVAHTHLALGDPQAALSYLQQAVVIGYPRVLVAADPGFESIRNQLNLIQSGEIGVD